MGVVAAGCANLQQARIDANEASAMGSLRAIVSAQMAYSSYNAGGYGSFECLVSPKNCNPRDPGQAHLDPGLAAPGERSGYRLVFHPGPDGDGAEGRPRGAALKTFAVVAIPASPGASGVRRFCIDDRAELCAFEASAEPTGKQCPASCVAVR